MNFYIGNSKDAINEQDINVEFSDKLIDFIYKLGKEESFDMRKLYELDPYDDIEISKNDLQQIIEICSYILEESLLHNYEEPNDGKKMLLNLIEIAQKALARGSGLVSIGD